MLYYSVYIHYCMIWGEKNDQAQEPQGGFPWCQQERTMASGNFQADEA
jgi:hypothetical protein